MFDLTNIYKETKKLDALFAEKYSDTNPDIVTKNRLELLVELGELANETRCFKYWSIKQTGDKDKVLEEYIDCLFMILYFCNKTGVSLDEDFPVLEKRNFIESFITIFNDASSIEEDPNKEDVKKVLVECLNIAELLGFTTKDLEKVTKKKSKIINKRFNMDY